MDSEEKGKSASEDSLLVEHDDDEEEEEENDVEMGEEIPRRPPSPKYHNKSKSSQPVIGCLCITLCVLFSLTLLIYASVMFALYIKKNNTTLTFESANEASKRVRTIARGHWENLEDISRGFIAALRDEYRQRQLDAIHDWALGQNNDPLDHDRTSGTGQHHMDFFPGDDALPPVCPMLQDHLSIVWDLTENSFDPFGLPCAMEMHWSTQLDFNQVADDDRAFMNSIHKGGFGSSQKPVSSLPFHKIKCTRRYRLKGFTPWECTEYPELPTRYSMVYNIGCLDVNPKGEINVRAIERPNDPKDQSGRVQIDSTQEWINPAYDKTVQPLQAGHYCYINYAVTENATWKRAVNTSILMVVLCLVLTSVGVCCVTTSGFAILFSAMYWIEMSTLGVSSYIYLNHELYIHEHMLTLIQYGLLILGIGCGIVYAVQILIEFIFRSRCDIDNGCTENHPLCLKALDTILLANGFGSFIHRQRIRRLNETLFNSSRGRFIARQKPDDLEPPIFKDHLSDEELWFDDEYYVAPHSRKVPTRIVSEHERGYTGTIAADDLLNSRWASTEEREALHQMARDVIDAQDKALAKQQKQIDSAKEKKRKE
jgi:hypothetical protein